MREVFREQDHPSGGLSWSMKFIKGTWARLWIPTKPWVFFWKTGRDCLSSERVQRLLSPRILFLLLFAFCFGNIFLASLEAIKGRSPEKILGWGHQLKRSKRWPERLPRHHLLGAPRQLLVHSCQWGLQNGKCWWKGHLVFLRHLTHLMM